MVTRYFRSVVVPSFLRLQESLESFLQLEERIFQVGKTDSENTASIAIVMVIVFTFGIAALAIALSFLVTQGLSRQLEGAARKIQAAARNLEGTAQQQKAGITEQATALTEVSATMKELEVTSIIVTNQCYGWRASTTRFQLCPSSLVSQIPPVAKTTIQVSGFLSSIARSIILPP